MSRPRKTALFAFLTLAVVVLVVMLVFVALRGRTPAIRDEAGHRLPGSIAELDWIKLGGVRQAVLLRGADSTRPVVLFLHGGPGMPAMYLAHAFQRPVEKDFVMVQWDRRGAGKSYGARVPAESLTVRRTLDDLYELTRWLRTRFHQDRIVLVAHSWGTYLGLVAVRRHPEWYRAYIGMGQVVPDDAAADSAQRALVMEGARARGDTALVARLASGGVVTENDLFRVGGELRDATSFWPLLRTGLMAPEYTLFDAINVQRGSRLLAAALDRRSGPPMPAPGDTIQVPLFLFLGRYDATTPSELAAKYVASLEAPLEGVVWFEHSAHFPFFEEPDRFHFAMLRVDSMVTRYWARHEGQNAPPGRR